MLAVFFRACSDEIQVLLRYVFPIHFFPYRQICLLNNLVPDFWVLIRTDPSHLFYLLNQSLNPHGKLFQWKTAIKSRLIKDYVPFTNYTMSLRTPQIIICIANHYTLHGTWIKLSWIKFFWDMQVCNTSKDLQLFHVRAFSKPQFSWHHILQGCRGALIYNVDYKSKCSLLNGT